MKKCMDSENLHRRLKKIIGQLNAIDRMIDEDVPCENILMQLTKLYQMFLQYWNITLDYNYKFMRMHKLIFFFKFLYTYGGIPIIILRYGVFYGF